MPWRGPSYPGEYPTLGWQVLQWGHAYLPSPADETQPLVLTDEQAQIVLQWYEIDPRTGEYPWRILVLEESKGWGKSPIAAFLEGAEFAGETCFDGWDAFGEPVAVPWGYGTRPPPWNQIAAVSEDQTENTYGSLYAMLTANQHRAASALRIDDGRTRLFLRDRPGRLEPVTASAGSREGQRITKATADEVWLWKPSNGGVKLHRTLLRNLAKMGGRYVVTTNAPLLGEKSVAEMFSQTDRANGILFMANRPSKEPQPDWSKKQMRTELERVYRDARRRTVKGETQGWVDLDRLLREIADPQSAWEDTLRFWFNWRTSGEGAAIDPRLWDLRAVQRDPPPQGSYIGVGFDGSINDDATVVRGATPDGFSWNIKTWQRPSGAELEIWKNRHPGKEWSVDRKDVQEVVHETFARYKVGRMLCDPPKWYTEIEGWVQEFGEDVVIGLETNRQSKFAPAVDRWMTALREGTHTHDGDELTTEHVKSAHKKAVHVNADVSDGRTLYVLVKGDDGRRIDAAVTDVLAHEAALSMPPPPPPRRKITGADVASWLNPTKPETPPDAHQDPEGSPGDG